MGLKYAKGSDKEEDMLINGIYSSEYIAFLHQHYKYLNNLLRQSSGDCL